MSKARFFSHEERLAMTSRKMAFKEMMKHAHEVPAAPGVEEVDEKLLDDEHHCPYCGGELVRYEGCFRCKKCGWSKCG
ncbi:MAG: hypothetical protein IJP91_03110 [Synergistaceae bacterium]|nr:hypothetical protein [Synergistaceae bacterium]